jgi:protein tyrosine/serine phosphatase
VLLFFVSFSKLVILVYTGQPVENNTVYARYIITSFCLRTYNPKSRRLVQSTRSSEGSLRAPEVQKARKSTRSSEGLLRAPEVQKARKSTRSPEGSFRAPEVQKARSEHPKFRRLVQST